MNDRGRGRLATSHTTSCSFCAASRAIGEHIDYQPVLGAVHRRTDPGHGRDIAPLRPANPLFPCAGRHYQVGQHAKQGDVDGRIVQRAEEEAGIDAAGPDALKDRAGNAVP